MKAQTEPVAEAGNGIVVYRASRLEALLEPLEQLLQAFPPDQVLAPQTVIAAHPGMRHWLYGALARRRPAGIVANLRVVLASTWLDELAQSLLGSHAVALQPYRREHLRWRIHEALPDVDADEVRAYLAGEDAPRRRLQLADRLAGLYTQYMVYRPDWLLAWQQGRTAGPKSFQSALWRSLRAGIALPHRGERLNDLVAQIHRQGETNATVEPLHLFGHSHLAPAELHVLRALARQRPVVLYVPDPCREYWGGLRVERARLRALASLPVDGELQQELLQLDHPLLASWGRMGQHFVLALNEGEDSIRVDTRHWEDQSDAGMTASLLATLQESVRRLRHDQHLIDPARLLSAAARQDRSLRIHVCASRLRELEVLRDALLMELQQCHDLQPADIVVMAPDIQAYLALIPAIFGIPGRPGSVLPYHLADIAVARAHPIYDAFLAILGLPGARISAAELIDLLRLPLVARSLGIDANGVEALALRLAEARVAWGLDGAYRARFDVPDIAAHTLAWGMDRMLAGHVLGEDIDVAEQGFDGLWPLAVGGDAESLGALDRLLLEIAALDRASRAPARASAWVARLQLMLDRMFAAGYPDDEEREALLQLRACIQELASETAAAELDPELDFSVVRDLLAKRLAAVSARQRLLLGGVTFCGMVPQRAIPFRIIAVLGLNEGDYPRAPARDGLDLMQVQRRLGDRDVRDDDRYLFLETLMSARDALHLSYVGEGARDARPRNPAAPLAELMQFLDLRAGIDPQSDAPQLRPWLVRHPLQSFDPRNFDGRDPALFSFAGEWLAPVEQGAGLAIERGAVSPAQGTARAAVDEHVAIARLQAFYKDPARSLATQGLKIRLDALESERLSASEALQPRTEAIDRVSRQLILDALRSSQPIPEQAAANLILSGILPAGRLALPAYEHERILAQAALQAARALPCLSAGLPPRRAIQIDREIAGRRWLGRLARVYAADQHHLVLDVFPKQRIDALGFRERIPVFIEWAVLQLQLLDQSGSVTLCLVCAPEPARARSKPLIADWPGVLNGVDSAIQEARSQGDQVTLDSIRRDLQQRLCALLQIAEGAADQRLHYFPQTSWAALEGDADDVARVWLGDDAGWRAGERERAPGYAVLLGRDLEFTEGSADLQRLRAVAQRLRNVIAMEALS